MVRLTAFLIKLGSDVQRLMRDDFCSVVLLNRANNVYLQTNDIARLLKRVNQPMVKRSRSAPAHYCKLCLKWSHEPMERHMHYNHRKTVKLLQLDPSDVRVCNISMSSFLISSS